MKPDLPETIARYVAAQDRHDIEAMLACFSPDARVRDEGRTMTGADAVRAWIVETSAKYHITIEPRSYSATPAGAEMVSRISGTFPGSPINLTYRFGFAPDGRIASLDIA